MKRMASLLILTFVVLLGGCQEEVTMVLLDEKIDKIEVAKSKGAGEVNVDEILLTFTDRKSVRTIEEAITSAVKKEANVPERAPDFDILVHYEKDLPTHAIHIWLGPENEESILTYMVGGGEAYVAPKKMTNELRKLFLQTGE